MPEKFWIVAAHVDDPQGGDTARGDGSPMEEGSRTWWEPLPRAIAGCVDGRIEDAKTELALRRLADRLQ
jgi:ADP-ribose pyrophosphatase